MFMYHLSLEKDPKCSGGYVQKLICLSLKWGNTNANMAAVDSLILPALELNERMLKTFCILIGYNPVPTEIFCCMMIRKGRKQRLISRLLCECRYIVLFVCFLANTKAKHFQT